MQHLKAFAPEKTLIKEFKYWVVLQRPQFTLGACFFCLRRNIPSLAQMTADEAAELPKVIAWFEETCIRLYGAEKFNYLALMMKDFFVHFHAFPRYTKTVKRHGVSWSDVHWPVSIKMDLAVPVSCDNLVLEKIRKEMGE